MFVGLLMAIPGRLQRLPANCDAPVDGHGNGQDSEHKDAAWLLQASRDFICDDKSREP